MLLIAAPQCLGNAGIEFRYRPSSGEGTTVPDTIYYAPALPGIDGPNQLERCEASVRAYIAIGDVLQGINFQPSGNNAFQVVIDRLDCSAG